MYKLLQSLILTWSLLSAWENNEIAETKSSFTEKETSYLVKQILNKEKILIRWHKILNPGWKINDDIRNTIFEVARVVDEYIPENISLKWKITNQWVQPYGAGNPSWTTLSMYYNYKF